MKVGGISLAEVKTRLAPRAQGWFSWFKDFLVLLAPTTPTPYCTRLTPEPPEHPHVRKLSFTAAARPHSRMWHLPPCAWPRPPGRQRSSESPHSVPAPA